MSEARARLDQRVALAGRRPVNRGSIDAALDILAMAETGEVTAFVIVGAGAEFATIDLQTAMTRQDRLELIGELHQQIYILNEEEQRQRDAGK